MIRYSAELVKYSGDQVGDGAGYVKTFERPSEFIAGFRGTLDM